MLSELLSRSIPIEPEYKQGKEVTISLLAVVAKENDRRSINSTQKTGRARAQAGVEVEAPNRVATELPNNIAIDVLDQDYIVIDALNRPGSRPQKRRRQHRAKAYEPV